MMIGILGLGGAGGNIADEAAKLGFHTAAINFSQRDLDSLEHVEAKLRLMGSEGVGHNRDEAIRLLSDHYDVAINFVKEQFNHSYVEVLIFAFSTGGGSGSGISPILLDICSNVMPDKIFVAMPIIPELSEPIVSQINCLKTFEELSKLDICVLPIDNEKARSSSGVVGKNVVYSNTNETVSSLLHKVLSYTEKHSKNGVFDKRDLKTTLSTKGMGMISEARIDQMQNGLVDVSKNGVSNTIQTSWNNSIFAPIEFESAIRAAIVLDTPESLMQFLDYQQIFSPFTHGMPIDLFEGNYHENDSGYVYSILVGLKWCITRLEQIEKVVQDSKTRIEAVLGGSSGYESKVDRFPLNPVSTKQKTVKSVADILNKYRR